MPSIHDSSLEKFQHKQSSASNQANQGNREAKVKMNANKQLGKRGQRATGNRGQDNRSGK